MTTISVVIFQPKESGEAIFGSPSLMEADSIFAPIQWYTANPVVQKSDAMTHVSEKLKILLSHLLFFHTRLASAKLITFFYKILASMISEKKEVTSCSEVLWWIRCRHGITLLRYSIICIRGSRSPFWGPRTIVLSKEFFRRS